MSEGTARDREEAEAKAKRIERWRQTGRIFESTPDLRWLFIELALANGGELDWLDKDRLTDLVAEPILGSLWSDRNYCDALMDREQSLSRTPNSTAPHCATFLYSGWFRV